jgi:hypothetical protein
MYINLTFSIISSGIGDPAIKFVNFDGEIELSAKLAWTASISSFVPYNTTLHPFLAASRANSPMLGCTLTDNIYTNGIVHIYMLHCLFSFLVERGH